MVSGVWGEHDFYVKINRRLKSGDAVARATVALVQQMICHKGINTKRIIAHGGGSWGGGLIITLLAFRLV